MADGVAKINYMCIIIMIVFYHKYNHHTWSVESLSAGFLSYYVWNLAGSVTASLPQEVATTR